MTCTHCRGPVKKSQSECSYCGTANPNYELPWFMQFALKMASGIGPALVASKILDKLIKK